MPNLDIPGAGVIAFPDDMPSEQIKSIVTQHILPKVQFAQSLKGASMPPKVNAQPPLWEANAPAALPNPLFAPIFTPPVRKTPVLTQEDVENGSPALRQFQQGLDLVQPGVLKGVARGVGGMIDQTFNTPAGLASLPVLAAGGLPAKALGYGFLALQAAESKAPAQVLGTEFGKNPEDRDRTKMGEAGFNLGLPLAGTLAHPAVKLASDLGGGVAELGRQIKDPEGYFSDPLHGAYGGRGAPEEVGSLQWTGLRTASVPDLAKQVKGVDTAELHNGLADLQRTDRFPNLVQAYKEELLNRGETPVETPVDPKTVQLKPATASPVVNWVRQQEQKLGFVPTPVTRRAGVLGGGQQLQSGKPTGVLPPVPLTSITPTANQATGLPSQPPKLERSQNANQAAVPTVQPPTPQPPVAETKPSFPAAVRVNGKQILVGGSHGDLVASVQKQYTDAGMPVPQIERGFSNGKGAFYKTPLEVARAMQAQPKVENANAGTTEPITPTPPTVQGQKTVGQKGQAGKEVVPAQGQLQSAPQKEIPGGVGGVPGSAGTGNVQGVRPAGVNAPKPVSMAKWNKMTPEERTAQQWHEMPEWDVQKKHLGEAGFFRLGGGVDLSPLGWKSGARVQGDQAYNRIKNVLGAGSSAFKHLEDNGLKAFLATPKTVTELENWMNEVGPKVGTHVYGMEGKVSEAKKEFDKMTHEWRENLSVSELADWRDATHKMGMPGAPIQTLRNHLREQGWSEEKIKQASRYDILWEQVKAEPKDTSPRATSAYSDKGSRVAALSSEEPMPEWTTTKSGKNVQRVDVVVPQKLRDNYEQNVSGQRKGEQWQDRELWTPDGLHENLPNTLGWAMIQYTDAASVLKKYGHTLDEASIKILKANPDAKIGVIAEAQSRWAQEKRTYYERIKAGMTPQKAGEGLQYRPGMDHPLADNPYRLILKAAIDQAQKEGATHIVVSDEPTVAHTEGHDLKGLEYYKEHYEKGNKLNYDNILPKIMEELTGSKGEMVSLGEHKNAMERSGTINRQDEAGYQQWLRNENQLRKNLIFRNADGTPKTDVSGRIYRIKHVDPSKFTTFGKDKAPSSVQSTDRTGEAGSLFPKTKVIDNPKFKKWFGKSRVVDEKGVPLVVYHGTTTKQEFTQFDPTTFRKVNAATSKLGSFFGTSKVANEFVEPTGVAYQKNGNPRIYPVYLSIQNPKEFASFHALFDAIIERDTTGRVFTSGGDGAENLKKELIAQGYDGIKYTENKPFSKEDMGTSYVIFNPSQVKSAIGNSGEFSKTDLSIAGSIFPKTTGGQGSHFGPSRRALEERDEAPEPGEWAEVGEALNRGRALIAQGTNPEKVLANFLKDPEKMVSEDMIGVLFAHGADLAKKTADAADAHGVTSPEFKAAAKVERDWVERSRPPATAAGRTLQALQGQVDLDTGSVYSMVKRLSEGTDKEPTEAQVKYIEETAKASKEADAKVALKWQELQQRLDTLSKQLAEEQARPKVASKTASEILAMAAQHGVKGAGKALQGLNALFGTGTGRLGSGPTFDEKTWAAAKPLFQEAWNEWKAAGKDLGHFAQVALDTWGEKVQPYVERFVTEQGGKVSKPTATAVKFEPTTGAVRKTVTSKPAKSRGDLETAAVWEYAKRKYLEMGKTDFDTIRHGIAQDLGLTADEVGRILTRNSSVKVLSDEMYAAMDARRKLKQSAEFWLQDQKTPGWAKAVRTVPRLFFIDKIFGHGTVGMITHAGINVFNPGAWSTYFPSFLRQYKLAYSHTFHEQWVQDQVRKPNFVMWKRAGLKCDPYRYPDDYQNETIKAFFGKLNMVVGNYGFDALKDFRINRANQLWNKLPAELRLDENGKTNRKMAQMVADSVNHATGIVHMPFREWASYTFFASRLEASRWAWVVGDPAKAVGILKDWKNASPEDKAFAMAEFKQKAAVAGTYIAALMLNQGVLSMMGSDEKINFTDPKKSDFLAFKVAGHKVGIVGPMIGMVRLFVELCHDAIGTRGKLESLTPRGKEMGEDIWQYGRGKLSPFASFGLDIASQSDYAGRPLPWSQDKPSKNEPQLSYKEYGLSTFLPIPFEEALKEVWSEQGMDEGTMQKAFKFLGIAAGAGGTGVRIQPDKQPKPPSPPPEKNPFKVHGIKPPKALSMGDIINRPQGNFQVVDFDQDGHPLVEPV